jgi:uncharacterized membrane protein YdjX (TVP38/TMEM64 family)
MRRKLLLLGIFVLVVVALYLAVREYGQLETVARIEVQLRGLVERSPIISFATGLLLYTVLSLIPGTTGKSFVFGWLFGFWQALVQANVGLTIAAVSTFLLSRYVFRDVVQSKFGYYVKRFNTALEREGAYVVISLRMLHAPYSFLNYTMGTTSISTKTFWWSTQIGLLPGNVVFVLAGAQLPTLRDLLTKGAPAVFTPQFIAAFLLMAVFPWMIRWIISRARRRAHVPDPI